ncbi:MAG: nicotinamidase/pyrazinamidase [Parasphingorhabdus sp.]|jgi:nicotinamidase/pyrazinamidase
MINNSTDCLLVIDVQNDFCANGALAVPDGDAVVSIINRQSEKFKHRILTQDWHPADHQSFASNHDGKNPFDLIELDYGSQVLWPDHCVQGSSGAEFHGDLITDGAELILRKGFRAEIDSYSAFFENDQTTPTGLTGYFRNRGFSRLFMAGLATDFCVAYSALDARKEGFEVFLIEEGCRAIDMNGSLDDALGKMRDAGVNWVSSKNLS